MVWKVVGIIRSAKQEQKNSATKICADSSIEMVSSGSHWPSKVL